MLHFLQDLVDQENPDLFHLKRGFQADSQEKSMLEQGPKIHTHSD